MSQTIDNNLNNKLVDKSIYLTISELKKATKKHHKNDIKLSGLSSFVVNLQLSFSFCAFPIVLT